VRLSLILALIAASFSSLSATADTPPPHILQQPAISKELIAFTYAGDLWTVPRAGGRAMRLTTGVGIQSNPVFSPDGTAIAFTGDYDGNIDVFTIPATGGIPHRVTYHPADDFAVGWSRDGKSILFRSARTAASRYTQLFTVPAQGGNAKPLPLPMAYAGQFAPDGAHIAYTPLAPAFGFNFTSFTAWGNYHGGTAGTILITALPGLDTVEIPHEDAADFSPAYLGDKLYFLSGRKGHVGIFSYDPASQAVAEAFHNTGPDIRSLASDGQTLIFDQLGALSTLEPGGTPKPVAVDVTGDMPDVRSHILNAANQIEAIDISPTGLRVAVEAHGEILTVPAKHGPMRNITNTPGVMEREPAWSPDGQSIAYFSDESGLYALHVAAQTGAVTTGAVPVRKFPLGAEAVYYFAPLWSPDSKRIAFYDNRLHTYLLDLSSGQVKTIGQPDTFGGFVDTTHDMAWSPDSKWLVYPHSMTNHLHALMLYSVDKDSVTQLTDAMADARFPCFDRSGKYLYFAASNNAGATQHQLDMSSDLYGVTRSIYALTLKADIASPIAPESDDEKLPDEIKAKAKEDADTTPAGQAHEAATEAKAHPDETKKPPAPKPTEIDLAGLPIDTIAARIVAMPLPARHYTGLGTGKPGILYFLEDEGRQARGETDERGATLSRFVLADRKTEKLAERVQQFELTADGEKMLVATLAKHEPDKPQKPASYAIVPANAPVKAGEGELSLDPLEIRVDPAAEWAQMYREVWRIERAYFYDPHFHGVDTAADERRLAPYAAAIQSRADLNYIFQEMLTGFSVGHLRGSGGAIPSARRVAGGLLGADYIVKGEHYCLAKIYTGGTWSPEEKAPLAQPGLNVHEGDCILAINGAPLGTESDIQQPLEGTAGHAVTLRIADAGGQGARDITVIPIASEAKLRNLDWIEGNRRKVDALSGGKLAYVYLPNTAEGGFTSFNRYYFAQTDKQGAIIDERFNAGGQAADYIIEVLGRKIESYWAPRYGAVDHTPSAGIYGPKVMIANEASGSGGDLLPWLFKFNQLGPLVGKRTWGGLVGIGDIPVLMDGGRVTSPSVGFFSPGGEWDVENHGVAPDYPVEQDPKAVAAGHDPQLEKAVALAMDKLKQNPPVEPKRPAYPEYH
jgi:tricorn protease